MLILTINDAHGFRRELGKHAATLNELTKEKSPRKLRERMGHEWAEILGGLFVGLITSMIINEFVR